MFVDPNLNWRIYSMNFAFGGIALVVAAELRRIPDKGPIEKILLLLALLSGLNFLVRPILAVIFGGPYDGDAGFYSSLYWTTTILSHAVLVALDRADIVYSRSP